jgi:3-isopropylmalate/(R)-2-methylmalate dehydratase small subunit
MKRGSKITEVAGSAVPLRGNDIDTDRIIPARYLRCVTFDDLGPHAFEDDRQQNPAHPFNQPQYQGANIILVGKNFGCGSSREHAPQSLSKWGIEAVVGESFAEIFFGNCQAMGIPCVTVSAGDIETLFAAVEKDPKLVLKVDLTTLKVSAGALTVQGCMPDGVRQSLVAGTWNATMILLEAGAAIEAAAARLPKLQAS